LVLAVDIDTVDLVVGLRFEFEFERQRVVLII
jgi:hypothetical protein